MTILLLEDDVVDVMNVKRAFKKNNISASLIVVPNGQEALDYLHKKGKYADQEDWRLPQIILLDLNMPVMDGLEFLEIVKSDETIKRIPAIVLTTSRDEGDRMKGFELNIAGYIVKPVAFEDFVQAVHILDNYWLLSELPYL